jgi:hypothetical protein
MEWRGNLIGRANESTVERMKLIKTKNRPFGRMVKFNRKKEDNQTEGNVCGSMCGENMFL